MLIAQMSIVMLAALAMDASGAPDLTLPAPLEGARDGTMLRPHLFIETLRVPFGDDWGGETFLYTPLGHRLSLGLLMRAWNEATCDRPSCTDRALEGGVELRYQVKPDLEVGVGIGVQKGAAARSGPAVLPRIHLKF